MSVATDILVWLVRHADLVVFVLLFTVGMVTLPLLGMISKGLLPAFLAEPLATNVWRVTLAGLDGGRLHQCVTDEYIVERRTGEGEPENFWSRIAGQPLGVSYDRTKEAFGDLASQLDPQALQTDGGDVTDLPGAKTPHTIERGGHKTYLDTKADAGLFVQAAEVLATLKDSDGLDHVTEAEDQTMKEEAGDSRMETKWRVIYCLGMAFFGISGGVGVFFVL